MSKYDKILDLTSNKTKQITFLLNEEMIELFKKACEMNNVKPTRIFESWIIDYLDKNGLI